MNPKPKVDDSKRPRRGNWKPRVPARSNATVPRNAAKAAQIQESKVQSLEKELGKVDALLDACCDRQVVPPAAEDKSCSSDIEESINSRGYVVLHDGGSVWVRLVKMAMICVISFVFDLPFCLIIFLLSAIFDSVFIPKNIEMVSWPMFKRICCDLDKTRIRRGSLRFWALRFLSIFSQLPLVLEDLECAKAPDEDVRSANIVMAKKSARSSYFIHARVRRGACIYGELIYNEELVQVLLRTCKNDLSDEQFLEVAGMRAGNFVILNGSPEIWACAQAGSLRVASLLYANRRDRLLDDSSHLNSVGLVWPWNFTPMDIGLAILAYQKYRLFGLVPELLQGNYLVIFVGAAKLVLARWSLGFARRWLIRLMTRLWSLDAITGFFGSIQAWVNGIAANFAALLGVGLSDIYLRLKPIVISQLIIGWNRAITLSGESWNCAVCGISSLVLYVIKTLNAIHSARERIILHTSTLAQSIVDPIHLSATAVLRSIRSRVTYLYFLILLSMSLLVTDLFIYANSLARRQVRFTRRTIRRLRAISPRH